jgi:F-type H+-transporting ATPase subunit epsilon
VSGFTLHLASATCGERIPGVASFVGADASGSFGILPGRARFLTVLDYGLARFRITDRPWRYLVDDDYGCVSALLAGQLAKEEAELKAVKDNLQRLEHELFRRLRQIDRWRS